MCYLELTFSVLISFSPATSRDPDTCAKERRKFFNSNRF